MDLSGVQWIHPSRSGQNNDCVEVGVLPDGSGIALRDTKNLDREPFVFNWREWSAFAAGMADGEFPTGR